MKHNTQLWLKCVLYHSNFFLIRDVIICGPERVSRYRRLIWPPQVCILIYTQTLDVVVLVLGVDAVVVLLLIVIDAAVIILSQVHEKGLFVIKGAVADTTSEVYALLLQLLLVLRLVGGWGQNDVETLHPVPDSLSRNVEFFGGAVDGLSLHDLAQRLLHVLLCVLLVQPHRCILFLKMHILDMF